MGLVGDVVVEGWRGLADWWWGMVVCVWLDVRDWGGRVRGWVDGVVWDGKVCGGCVGDVVSV